MCKSFKLTYFSSSCCCCCDIQNKMFAVQRWQTIEEMRENQIFIISSSFAHWQRPTNFAEQWQKKILACSQPDRLSLFSLHSIAALPLPHTTERAPCEWRYHLQEETNQKACYAIKWRHSTCNWVPRVALRENFSCWLKISNYILINFSIGICAHTESYYCCCRARTIKFCVNEFYRN